MTVEWTVVPVRRTVRSPKSGRGCWCAFCCGETDGPVGIATSILGTIAGPLLRRLWRIQWLWDYLLLTWALLHLRSNSSRVRPALCPGHRLQENEMFLVIRIGAEIRIFFLRYHKKKRASERAGTCGEAKRRSAPHLASANYIKTRFYLTPHQEDDT